MQRGGDQPWIEAILTEDDIFTLPIPCAGSELDGGAEDYSFLALECIQDCKSPDVFQSLQMEDDEGILQQIMQEVNSDDVQQAQGGEEEMRSPPNRRPPRRKGKASSSKRKVRSTPSSCRKKSSVRRNPGGGRSWQDVEKERVKLEKMFAEREVLAAELYDLQHPYPNSRFKHPYVIPAPDVVYPVFNSSNFAPRVGPTQAPDFMLESTLPSPSSPEHFITNSYSTLLFPAPPPPTPPLADYFTASPTTWIDPVEVSMAELLQQDPTPASVPFFLNPALYEALSKNTPRFTNLYSTDSTVMTTMRIEDDDVQVLAANSMSSPQVAEDFPEATLLQLDVAELQEYVAHQGYNIAKPCAPHDDTQTLKDLDRSLHDRRARLKQVEEENWWILNEPVGS